MRIRPTITWPIGCHKRWHVIFLDCQVNDCLNIFSIISVINQTFYFLLHVNVFLNSWVEKKTNVIKRINYYKWLLVILLIIYMCNMILLITIWLMNSFSPNLLLSWQSEIHLVNVFKLMVFMFNSYYKTSSTH